MSHPLIQEKVDSFLAEFGDCDGYKPEHYTVWLTQALTDVMEAGKESAYLTPEMQSYAQVKIRFGAERELERILAALKTDYPTAWKIQEKSDKENHHQMCSYRKQAMLCDCAGIEYFSSTMKHLRLLITSTSKGEGV